MTPKSAAGNLTGDEVRKFFRTIAETLSAMADGRITIDGQTIGEHPEALRDLLPGLSGMLGREDGAMVEQTPARVIGKRNTPAQLNPRRVYELIPQKKQLDLDGLTPAAVAIVKYLSTHEKASIRELMEQLHFKRSTVANSLTVLKNRKIVKVSNILG